MGVINKIKKILRKGHFVVYKIIKNVFYEMFIEDFLNRYHNNIKIVSSFETLNKIEDLIIRNERGVYLRFGDGDIFLLKNIADSYQIVNKELSIEMEEAFSLQGSNVVKCLAIHSEMFGFDKGMFSGNHLNTDRLSKLLLKNTMQYFIGHKIYSPVALHFVSSVNAERANHFLKILKLKTKIFIGNENVPKDKVQLLFGDSKHIKTPKINSYNEIDRIFLESKNAINNLNEFSVICVAMGCSGRPLIKRISYENKNVFLFDFGSLLDGLIGLESRTWLKVADIDYETLIKGL